jgi:predicted DNA-binding protein
MDILLQLLRKFSESLRGGPEMGDKSIIVSIRIDPELYKKVKKAVIDRDDTVTAIVKRAFERYIEEGKEMSKDVMSFEEFKKEYSERAAQLVDKCRKGENPLLVKKMRNELEPGYFVASAWKLDDTDTIHYEEYWELSNTDKLDENCVPDVHIEVTF